MIKNRGDDMTMCQFFDKNGDSVWEELEEKDMVNSPSHYKLDGLDIESKDVIKATYGAKGYIYWACGNAMKYLFRWEKKNGLEDLKKARKNLDFAIETLESEDVL